MSRGSVLARAIGLTKSFSGLTFERDEPTGRGAGEDIGDSLDRVEPVAETAAETASLETEAIAAETGPATDEAAASEARKELDAAADEGSDPEEMALSAVTIVPETNASTMQMVEAISHSTPPVEDAPEAPMVDAIAADIASLLSSLDSTQHDGVTPAPVALTAANEDEEDQTVVLLGELNRLWLAGRSRSSAYMR
jgi:hypothetical protein